MVKKTNANMEGLVNAFKCSSSLNRLFSVIALVLALPAALAENTDEIQSEIDRLFASAQSGPGGSVLVARDGKILHQQGYGLANMEWEIPATPSTRLRIGSITKCFTAVAILQLQEAGALNINEPVGRYLTNYPNAEKFSIRHLLTHTAGVSGSRKDSLDFTPGDRVDYSNEGYMILGQVVEKVSGKPYAQYLQESVFGPLKMLNSGMDRGEMVVRQRASGYRFGPDGTVQNAACTDAAGAHAAGGLYSTVEDLWAFDQALYGEALLKSTTLREAFTPVKLNDGRAGAYGYGWMLRQFHGLFEVGHGGDIEGFNSYLLRFPEQKCTIIVLCNVSMHARGALPTAGDLAHQAAAIVLKDALKPEPSPSRVALDSAAMNLYAGIYEYNAPPPFLERTGKTLTIVREGDALFGIDKNGKAELVPESATQFSPKGSPVKLKFRLNAEGRPTEVLLNVGGVKEISAKRVQ